MPGSAERSIFTRTVCCHGTGAPLLLCCSAALLLCFFSCFGSSAAHTQTTGNPSTTATTSPAPLACCPTPPLQTHTMSSLSFQNSFWSNQDDYESGLVVLYAQLKKGCFENEKILALLTDRKNLEQTYEALSSKYAPTMTQSTPSTLLT